MKVVCDMHGLSICILSHLCAYLPNAFHILQIRKGEMSNAGKWHVDSGGISVV